MSCKHVLACAAAFSVVAFVVAACGGAQPTAPAQTATPVPSLTPASPATPTAAPTITPSPRPTAIPTPVPPTPTPAAPPPKYGGTLTMRMSRTFDVGDTYRTDTAFSIIWLQNLLNNVTALNSKQPSKIEPDTAERWEIGQDARSATFYLRKDVVWSDGKPFTAADVKFNLERGAFPTDPRATQNKAALAALDRVEVTDEYTVRAVLKRPSVSFLPSVSVPFMLMYPAHFPEASRWDGKPATGPYKLKERRVDVSFDLERNPGYFKKDSAGRQLPFLDGIRIFVIPDQASVLAAFRSGNINCACGFGSDILVTQIDQIRSSIPNVKLAVANPLDAKIFFGSKPPMDDVRVRRAVSLWIDRRQVHAVFREGKAFYPPGYLLAPELGGLWGLPKEEILQIPGFREPKTIDLDEARRLLSQAGINPSTFEFDLIAPAPSYTDLGELIANVMINSGLRVRYRPLRDPESAPLYEQNNFHMGILPAGSAIDDPSGLLLTMMAPGGGRNFGKWEDQEMSRLIDAQEGSLDVAKRRELLRNLQRRLHELAWVIPIVNVPGLYGAWPYIEDIELERQADITSFHRIERLWMSR